MINRVARASFGTLFGSQSMFGAATLPQPRGNELPKAISEMIQTFVHHHVAA